MEPRVLCVEVGCATVFATVRAEPIWDGAGIQDARTVPPRATTSPEQISRGVHCPASPACRRGRRCGPLRAAGEREGGAFGVAADHPALARVDDLAAERTHPFGGGSEVGDGEVGKREAVARPAATLVQPDHDALVLGLPAAPILWPTALQRRLEQPLPEPAGAFSLVGGKLDQEPRHQHSHRTGNPSGAIASVVGTKASLWRT